MLISHVNINDVLTSGMWLISQFKNTYPELTYDLMQI